MWDDGRPMDWFEMAVALVVILTGAELFTNGVEWVGEALGLSEGAVGSVLAAIGTALPETVLPFIAILAGGGAGKEIGTGAILGAPFMLATLAMFVAGVALLVFARGGRRDTAAHPVTGVVRQDLSFFLVMYGLAVLAGLVDIRPLDWALVPVLLGGYVLYVRRHFRAPAEAEVEAEATGAIEQLRLRALLRWAVRRGPATGMPPAWQSVAQTLVGLAFIVGGARAFVAGMETAATAFHVPHLVFALLVAPVATELPETFNSALWLRRGKDTLAVGNVTGALVFQSTFPVTIGLLFTPWRLVDDRFGLVSAFVALAAGLVVYATIRLRGRLAAWLLLGQGALYAAYVAYVVVAR